MEKTLVKLRATSMKAFIKYYEEFKMAAEGKLSNSDIIDMMDENWTENSKASRTSKGKSIFVNNQQLKALRLISEAGNIPNSLNQRAKQLYIKELADN